MATSLAKTSFESGSDAALAAPDAYPKVLPTVLVSDTVGPNYPRGGGGIPEISGGGFGGGMTGPTDFAGILGSILGPGSAANTTANNQTIGRSSGGSLSDLLNKDLKGLLGNSKDLAAGIDKITRVLNGDKNLIRDLSKGVVGDMLTSAGFGKVAKDMAGALMDGRKPMDAFDILAKNNPQLQVIIDGVQVVVGAKDIKSIDDLLGVASRLSGMDGLGELLDISAQMSVVKGLVDKANELKIPALANSLLDTIKNPTDRKIIEIASALGAASGSNMTALDTMLEKYGSDNIRGLYPEIVGTLLSNYKLPDGAPFATPAQAADLVTMCNELDIGWFQTERNGVMVPQTEKLLGLSKDAREVLMKNNTLKPIIMMAEEFQKIDLIALARRQYPRTPIPLT